MPPMLGRQLLATLEDVNALFAKAATRPDIDRIDTQRTRLLHQIGALVDRNLDRASQDYIAATQALQAASDEIKHALQRLERVAQAITVLARALDAVAKLAAV